MQGVWIEGQRPRTKQSIREAVAQRREVFLEATDPLGDQYEGSVFTMPEGTIAYFYGPDPHVARHFSGSVMRVGSRISIK